MKQGYEGMVVSGIMLAVALAAVAIAKWVF